MCDIIEMENTMKIKRILLITALICLTNRYSNFTFTQNDNNSNENVQETVEVFNQNEAIDLGIQAKASFLMDYDTGSILYAKNETQRLPIASMCKIMTLTLCFEAIDNGLLAMNDEICVSERAASMGGSQVFLEANAKYPVYELIKSIIVCSANDSCVALAERISGSESIFIDAMNKKATELGADNTLFANCTGLPKEPQYSCAKDVAIMLKSLLSHEEYYQFGKVWLDKFQHPEGRYTEITNTNKLIRSYDGCDGGKTGFTNEAGFCLAATAKRNNMRIISVVIGEENSKNRFDDVTTMFDYAFANYENKLIFQAENALNENVSVKGGREQFCSVYPQKDVYVFCRRGEKADIVTEIHEIKNSAPISKGDIVGELLVFKNGIEINRIPLQASMSIEKANIFDWLKRISQDWNARK